MADHTTKVSSKTRSFGIKQKIFIGFLTLIIIFAFNASLSVYTLNNSQELIIMSTEIVEPSLDAINEFDRMVIRSKMLITNWVFLQANEDDKQALRQLHNVEYSALNERIKTLMAHWKDKKQVAQMDSIFTKFEQLLLIQQGIMKELVVFEDYEDPIKKFGTSETIDTQIIPMTSELLKNLSLMAEQKRKEVEASKDKLLDSFKDLRLIIIGLGIILAIIGIVRASITANSITKPIRYIQDIVLRLSRGELPKEGNRKFANDEIGQMAGAVEKLVAGLRETSFFAENIGKGNLQANFSPLSEQDVLGNALLNMRANLEKVAQDDAKRSWQAEGVARFSELLRHNNDNISLLADEIISSIVKYLKANQGSLYVINETNSYQEPSMDLMACYAWDKKKFIEQKIEIGEGLTGQAWQENSTLYITDVPQEYISITSGLGGANPTSILIVPLKSNQQIFGVIELASFNHIEAHEIEFVEKIGESIASTLAAVKINARTAGLLEESQMMTEQMKAQEEEMRQNMEELQATQEEMERAQRTTFQKEKIIEATQMTIEFNTKFEIQKTNSLFQEFIGFSEYELHKQKFSKIGLSNSSLEELESQILNNQFYMGSLKFINKQGEMLKTNASAGKVLEGDGESRYLVFLTSTNGVAVAER